ncbi:MAG: cell division protein SepF [Rhodoluna sp.]
MAGAVDWIKELIGFTPRGPKPVSQPRSSSVRPDRARVQRPARGNYGAQRIDTIVMDSYNDAIKIADVLRENVTAIINVQNLSSTDRARLIDFLSGLKAGLNAQSSRVSEDVYLLAPEHVEIEPEEESVEDDDDGDRLIIRP